MIVCRDQLTLTLFLTWSALAWVCTPWGFSRWSFLTTSVLMLCGEYHLISLRYMALYKFAFVYYYYFCLARRSQWYITRINPLVSLLNIKLTISRLFFQMISMNLAPRNPLLHVYRRHNVTVWRPSVCRLSVPSYSP